jgi:uncharacterized protein YjbI with pentapeptide repeats
MKIINHSIQMSNMNQFLYDLVLSGADKWNQYRSDHPAVGMDPTKEDTEANEEWRQRVARIVNLDFTGADFQGLVLSGYDLHNASFCNANCRNACFTDCDLGNADFREAQLDGCRLQSCRLVVTAFAGCDLRNVRFCDCEGVLVVNPQTSFIGAEVLDSQLEYLCFESIQKDSAQSEFSITEMTLQNELLVPTETEVKIAEVRQSIE